MALSAAYGFAQPRPVMPEELHATRVQPDDRWNWSVTPTIGRTVGSSVSAKRLKRDPGGKAVQAFAFAQMLFSRGDQKGARKWVDKALERDPDYLEARIASGILFADRGDWTKAVDQFEKAIASDSHYGPAYYNLGVGLMKLGQPKDAERAAEQALLWIPKDPLANYLYSLSVMGQGKVTDLAVERLRMAAETLNIARQMLTEFETLNNIPSTDTK